jgi:hypothetical protein
MTSRLARLAGLAGIALLGRGLRRHRGVHRARPHPRPRRADAGARTDAAALRGRDRQTRARRCPDLSSIFGSVDLLDSLDRYKISVEIAGGERDHEDGRVTTIREPVAATKIDMTTAGQQISIIKIADKALAQPGRHRLHGGAGGGDREPHRRPCAREAVRVVQNQDAFKYLTPTGTETKNGVQATHYHVDDQTPLPPGGRHPPGVNGDIWDPRRLPRRPRDVGINTDVTGQGTIDSMKIEVTNINDAALAVEPPK